MNSSSSVRWMRSGFDVISCQTWNFATVKEIKNSKLASLSWVNFWNISRTVLDDCFDGNRDGSSKRVQEKKETQNKVK